MSKYAEILVLILEAMSKKYIAVIFTFSYLCMAEKKSIFWGVKFTKLNFSNYYSSFNHQSAMREAVIVVGCHGFIQCAALGRMLN